MDVIGTDIQVILGLPSYLSCVNTCKAINQATTAAVLTMGADDSADEDKSPSSTSTTVCSCRSKAFMNNTEPPGFDVSAVILNNASTTCLFGPNTPEKRGKALL